jgi:hypothetical protein
MTLCPACGQPFAGGVPGCFACGAEVTRPPRPQTLPLVERTPRWALSKAGHRAEAFARSTPWGPELLITIDGRLLWSHTYRGMHAATFSVAVMAKREAFEAKGWRSL